MTPKNTRFIAADIENVDREKVAAMIHQFIDTAVYELKQSAGNPQTVFEIESKAANSKSLITEMTLNNDILTALVLALQTGIYQEFTQQKLHSNSNENPATQQQKQTKQTNPTTPADKENQAMSADKSQEPNQVSFEPVNVDLVDRRELVDLVSAYLEQAQNHLIQKTPHTEFTHQEIKTAEEEIKQDLTVLVCNRAAFRVLLNVFEAGAWHKDKQTQQQQDEQQQKETQTNTTPNPAKKKEVIPIE